MISLQEIWKQARSNRSLVRLDDDCTDSVIYRGVKIVNDDGNISIYSTESEFYIDITKVFLRKSFKEGVYDFLCKKYLRQLNAVEKSIKNEMNNQKNHKKFKYLQAKRFNIIEKYNEINSEKITR